MSMWLVIAVAAATAIAAAALSPAAARLTDRDSAWTHPLVLATMGGAGGAVAAIAAPRTPIMVGYALFAVGCALLVAIDAVCHRLPDVVTYPTFIVLVLAFAVDAVTERNGASLLRAVTAAAVVGLVLLVLALISPRSLGLGDVKLGALLALAGGWLSWTTVLTSFVVAFTLGGLLALFLLLTRRADRHTGIAFGPWLILGAALALLAQSAPLTG